MKNTRRDFLKLTGMSVVGLGCADNLFASGPASPETSLQFNWTPYLNNPVLKPGPPGSWDENIRERMWVIYEDGKFHGWYGGWKGKYNKDVPNLCHLGYAVSDDGLHWKKYGNQPVYSNRWCEDMSVVKSGDTYYMYLEDESAGETTIHLLTSRDKINWTEQGTVLEKFTDNDWEKDWVGTPLAWKEGNDWYLLYEGGNPGDIGLAKSRDGIKWNRIKQNLVLPEGTGWEDYATAPDSILKKNGTYHLFYHATGKIWQTGMATSRDLIHWIRHPGNPIIPYPSAVIVETQDRYLMYVDNDRDDPQGIYVYTSLK